MLFHDDDRTIYRLFAQTFEFCFLNTNTGMARHFGRVGWSHHDSVVFIIGKHISCGTQDARIPFELVFLSLNDALQWFDYHDLNPNPQRLRRAKYVERACDEYKDMLRKAAQRTDVDEILRNVVLVGLMKGVNEMEDVSRGNAPTGKKDREEPGAADSKVKDGFEDEFEKLMEWKHCVDEALRFRGSYPQRIYARLYDTEAFIMAADTPMKEFQQQLQHKVLLEQFAKFKHDVYFTLADSIASSQIGAKYQIAYHLEEIQVSNPHSISIHDLLPYNYNIHHGAL